MRADPGGYARAAGAPYLDHGNRPGRGGLSEQAAQGQARPTQAALD